MSPEVRVDLRLGVDDGVLAGLAAVRGLRGLAVGSAFNLITPRGLAAVSPSPSP